MRLIVTIACVILAGCSTVRDTVTSSPKSDVKMVYVKPAHENYRTPWSNEGLTIPNWIYDPGLDDKYEGGVGSCVMTGKTLTEAKDEAYKYAISEISMARKCHVKSVVKNYQREDNTSYLDYSENVVKVDAEASVTNAVIADTWTQPNTRELYVWVIVKK